MKQPNTKKIVKISALSAIAFVLYFILEFPLLPGAPFLKFDFSDVAALVGGFALGPIAGVLIELLKNVLHLLLKANEGSPVGELANFIVGSALILPAALVYRKNKTRKSALLGMAVGTVCLTIVAALFNYFVFIPLYSPTLLDSGAGTYIMSIIVPFNLIKGVIVSIVTFILYKYISPLLHK
jgi:riboflavin transporter FmnP